MESHDKSPILLNAGGVSVSMDDADLALWRNIIGSNRAASLPNIFTPDFSKLVRSMCQNAVLEEQEVDGVGKRLVEPLDRVGKMLSLVLSGNKVMEWVSSVGGRGAVNKVSGRLAAMPAGGDEFLDWHDDNFEGRRLAVVIDLTEKPFEGGEFQLRRREDQQVIFRHHLQGFGTALLFHIADDLEHRLLPVTSGGPRQTFAGWFFHRP